MIANIYKIPPKCCCILKQCCQASINPDIQLFAEEVWNSPSTAVWLSFWEELSHGFQALLYNPKD